MHTLFDNTVQATARRLIRPVFYRLMIPLSIIVLLLLIGFTTTLLLGEQRNLHHSDQQISTDALQSFDISIKQQAKMLSAVEEALLNDPKLYEPLQDQDRERLYALYGPLYKKLLDNYSLTHFYFHLPDRVNLLRMHKPELHGDLINRFTAREAERLGKTSSGIELGPLGTLTLRVVRPVRRGDTLIGYLELGQEIDELLSLIHEQLGVEVAVTIHKKGVDRQQWETGMKMLGRKADWDRFAGELLAYHSLPQFPSECDRFIRGAAGNGEDRLTHEARFNNRTWQILVHSLRDVSGTDIGDLLILRDTTDIKADFSRFATITIGLALLLLGGLIAFFYVILRHTDRSIQLQQTRLAENEERQRALLDAINRSGIYLLVVDGAYHVKYMNTLMKETFGDMTGKLCYHNVAGYDSPCPHCHLQKIVDSQETVHREFTMANGRTFDMIGVPYVNSDGTVSNLEVMQDITEQKQNAHEKILLEQKLQRAEKMEAIGLLASSVAHDLNNILSGIVSYPELLLMQLAADSNMRKPLRAIQESGNRAAAVVADLLTVARGVASVKKPHDLNTLVQEYLHSPECTQLKSLHPQIVCRCQLDASPSRIQCSPVHIKKVVMNLVTNAAEAISGDGTIVIATAHQQINAATGLETNVKAGEYIVLTVSDTGSGISNEDIKHIFDPFYSRKILGRSGTGLGLAIVWNTVQDHDGAITVSSSNQGTCFTLYFPVSEEQGGELPDTSEKVNLAGHGEHILIVDDEPQLRDIASQMLQALGYKVHSVCSGELAIKFVQENPVDLIVLDMQMEPGMNGRQTYEEIIKLIPGQKAIIASGFSESDDVKAALRLGARGFMKKPYSMVQLGQGVKEALSAPQAAVNS